MKSGDLAISRRSFICGGVGTVASSALTVYGARAFGQEASLTGAQFRASGKSAKIIARQLHGDLQYLDGSGGNIIVLPGRDGIVTVDSGLATSEPQIRTALGAISSKPLRHLLNTHWHFDHTDGNEWMHLAGATIVAHENTRKRMTQSRRYQHSLLSWKPHCQRLCPRSCLPGPIGCYSTVTRS